MLPINSIKISAQHLPASKVEYVYSMAGSDIVFTRELPALKAFFKEPREVDSGLDMFEYHNFDDESLCYKGRAPFANELREVAFYRKGEFAQISVDQIPACQISIKENHIHVINGDAFDSSLNLELLTGPALIFLLAQQGVFCLHAGTVAAPVGNIAIIAESGAGKSTLSMHAGDDWSQLSDDILPVYKSGLLSVFPQLKCQNAITQGRINGSQILNAIIRIKPKASADIEFSQLNQIEAMLQIIRHTVASKLFDAAQLTVHTDFAKTLASEVPVIEVSYPRELSQLPILRERISEYLIDNFSN